MGIDFSVLGAGGDAGSHRYADAAVLADCVIAIDWIWQCACHHVDRVAHLSCGDVDVREARVDSGSVALGEAGMIEVEKKFRLTKRQRDAVLKRLPEMGASLEGEEFEENTLYSGEALRAVLVCCV